MERKFYILSLAVASPQNLWDRRRTLAIIRGEQSPIITKRNTIFPSLASHQNFHKHGCSNDIMEFYQLTAGRVIKSIFNLLCSNHTDLRPRKCYLTFETRWNSEHICKLSVGKLEQNRWSLIAVFYNHAIEESLAIKWKLDEVTGNFNWLPKTYYNYSLKNSPKLFHFTRRSPFVVWQSRTENVNLYKTLKTPVGVSCTRGRWHETSFSPTVFPYHLFKSQLSLCYFKLGFISDTSVGIRITPQQSMITTVRNMGTTKR